MDSVTVTDNDNDNDNFIYGTGRLPYRTHSSHDSSPPNLGNRMQSARSDLHAGFWCRGDSVQAPGAPNGGDGGGGKAYGQKGEQSLALACGCRPHEVEPIFATVLQTAIVWIGISRHWKQNGLSAHT